MRTPIMDFKNDKNLYKSLKEWQTRLFLNNWIIKARLASYNEVNENTDGPSIGCNHLVPESSCAIILIAEHGNDIDEGITRVCHEQVLVHELLHCKYELVIPSDHTYVNIYMDIHEHALIEQMAKSLIMAKYNLPFEWFANFEYPNI